MFSPERDLSDVANAATILRWLATHGVGPAHLTHSIRMGPVLWCMLVVEMGGTNTPWCEMAWGLVITTVKSSP